MNTHELSNKCFFFNVVVYQTGSMLEMSNGYPHSGSPLGGSPSPGPSPGIGAHHNKCKHVIINTLLKHSF